MIQTNVKGVMDAASFLRNYDNALEDKCRDLCQRLADIGVIVAKAAYNTIAYTGNREYEVMVEPTEKGCAVVADGETVLFLEFGAGVTYGCGHPKAQEFGMGPGTYPPTNPNNPHWKDPNGWYIPGGEHTYGNAPSMGMYFAGKTMREQIETIAREVFANDRR